MRSAKHKVIRLEFAEELKRALGEEALCFSVDTKGGRVAVKGWKDSVDLTPEEAVTWLEDSCAAFLYTHVDTEGTMQGFPLDVAAVLRACTAKQLIVAGGIKERSEVDALDAMGVDAVAGMAVYSGAMEALGRRSHGGHSIDSAFCNLSFEPHDSSDDISKNWSSTPEFILRRGDPKSVHSLRFHNRNFAEQFLLKKGADAHELEKLFALVAKGSIAVLTIPERMQWNT